MAIVGSAQRLLLDQSPPVGVVGLSCRWLPTFSGDGGESLCCWRCLVIVSDTPCVLFLPLLFRCWVGQRVIFRSFY